MEQRKLLFEWLRRWGLNCYMYAPKDELKHRLLWREPYTEHEAAHMRSLMEAAQEQGVQFVFAISAGQDMVFSSAGDRLLLQQKLRQVAAMGCQAFALLFDDIDPCMCQADRDAFPSLAQAQASVANEVYQELGQPPIFLFCPTEYCSSLCSPSPSQSCYLLTIGRELLPGIGVIWTGPKVVSQELSAVLLEEVEAVLQRRPIIWDNLYANDYDCRRVFLGPYTGRAPGLTARLHGLLLNPNCELQANFIPIHTLGSWFRSELGSCAHPDHTGMEPVAAPGDSPGPQDGSYSPQEALELALRDWVAEINRQALEPGARSPGHGSISPKGGAELEPGTAGRDVLPDPRPHGSVPGETEQQDPEPCRAAGEGRRKVTSEPEQGSRSRTCAGAQQSPAGDREQLTAGSTESSEPSSAVPSAAQASQPAGASAAAESLHSPGPPVCGSDGTSTAQNLLPTGDARRGPGSSHQPCSSTQPELSRADTPQTPPGPGAGASPGPTAPLIDGAGASPGAPAPLIDGAGASPGPTASLTPEETRSSPMSLLIMEEARTSPTVEVTPEKHRSSPTAPLTLEEPRSSPMVPLTPEEPRSSPTAPLTPEEPRSSPMVPLTLEEPRSSPTAPLTPEEPRSSPMAPLTLEEVRMLVELFYLPYHHGPLAQRLLEHFRWLRANSLSVGVSAAAPDAGAVSAGAGVCHGCVPWVCAMALCHGRGDARCARRAGAGVAERSPSRSSAPRPAACTRAWWVLRGGHCSMTCTPTCGTSAMCCWLPAPSSSGSMDTSSASPAPRAPGGAALAGARASQHQSCCGGMLSPGHSAVASLESCRRCCPWGTALTSSISPLHSSRPAGCTSCARCGPGTRWELQHKEQPELSRGSLHCEGG
uniref:protein O-GlcNAcase n=1 Tax=Melopsittacus undulatus TaxID=13146 RepID=A0A8V5FQK9_MELUD